MKHEGRAQPVKAPKADAVTLGPVALELKLRLQTKGFAQEQLQDFFFKPYQAEAAVSIKALAEVFDSNGVDARTSLQLARHLVEQGEGPLDLERTAKQR